MWSFPLLPVSNIRWLLLTSKWNEWRSIENSSAGYTSCSSRKSFDSSYWKFLSRKYIDSEYLAEYKTSLKTKYDKLLFSGSELLPNNFNIRRLEKTLQYFFSNKKKTRKGTCDILINYKFGVMGN